MIRHGGVSEQRVDLCMFSRFSTRLGLEEPGGCGGGGLSVLVKAENLRDSWDYRGGTRENQSCVLPSFVVWTTDLGKKRKKKNCKG